MTMAHTLSPQAPLLVELLVEELPPKALSKLGQAFAHGIFSQLQSQGLLAEGRAEQHCSWPDG